MIRSALRVLRRASARLRPSPDPGRVVAVCHCHHPELVPELATVLSRLPPGAALYLTSSQDAVFDRWRGLARPPTTPTVLHRTENRGRDIRPFFEVAKELALDRDTLVLKLHGKQSDYSGRGENWRRDLLEGLLPDRRAPGFVAERFRQNPLLGMLGAPLSFISHPVYWGENRARIRAIMLDRFGSEPTDPELGFFAGSMFWIRGGLVEDLLPHVDLAAFEPEPLPRDGSYAHAVERVMCMAARRMGWEMGELGRPATLDPDHIRERKVAYL